MKNLEYADVKGSIKTIPLTEEQRETLLENLGAGEGRFWNVDFENVACFPSGIDLAETEQGNTSTLVFDIEYSGEVRTGSVKDFLNILKPYVQSGTIEYIGNTTSGDPAILRHQFRQKDWYEDIGTISYKELSKFI